MKDQILGMNTGTKLTVDPDPAHLELVHGKTLTSKHIPHLAGTDAERNGAKRPMGRRV